MRTSVTVSAVVSLVACLAAPLLMTAPARGADGDGWAVCTADGNVYVGFIGQTPRKVFDTDRQFEHACWSSDALYIYAITSGGSVYRMYNDGSSVETGAANSADLVYSTGAGNYRCPIAAYRPNPNRVLHVGGSTFSVLDANSHSIVDRCQADRNFPGEYGISTSGTRMAARDVDGNLFKMNWVSGGNNVYTDYYDDGCSASISPNGEYMTANRSDGDHMRMWVYNWGGGRIGLEADSGETFDNQRFAVNSNSWMVYEREDRHAVGIIKRSTSPDNHQNRFVFDVPGTDAEDYPDYYVGDSLPAIPSSATLPAVTTDNASIIGRTTARLNGNLTSTGGQNPTVRIHWGNNDAGTGTWDNAENLGTLNTGTFYRGVTGLTPSTTYYFRCSAQNAAGTAWGSVKSFTTAQEQDATSVVSFTTPSDGATLSGTVAINATAHDPDAGSTDGLGIENVIFSLNQGSAVIASIQENIATYDWNLDTTAYANGAYMLRATATSTSAAGGGSVIDQLTVTIDNAPLAEPFRQNAGPEGLVAIQAENASETVALSGHEWTFASSPAGCSGDGAMEATPNDGTNIGEGYAASSPRMDFEIDFVKTGIHYVWIRGLGDSDTTHADDTCHVGLDGEETPTGICFYPFNSSWTWTNTTADGSLRMIDVAAPGVHTLNVWMREDGLIVDMIVLTTDETYAPTGDGPAESPTGANAHPLAEDDAAHASENMTIAIAVLANDSDTDGDPLFVTDLTQPGNGSATIESDGRILYIPDSGVTGSDSFSYTVSDGQGGADTALVSVQVSPVNPLLPLPYELLVMGSSSTAITITWSGDWTGIDGYRVYHDDGQAWTDLGTAAFTAFTDETVVPGVTYTYHVVSYSGDSESAPSMHVTVAAEEPYVELISPNSGEVLFVGQEYLITWNTNCAYFDARILFSMDNGTTWNIIMPSWGSNPSQWTWVVGYGGQGELLVTEDATTCLIRIEHYETSQFIRDTMTETFTISTADAPGNNASSDTDSFSCAPSRAASATGMLALLLAAAAIMAGLSFDRTSAGNGPRT